MTNPKQISNPKTQIQNTGPCSSCSFGFVGDWVLGNRPTGSVVCLAQVDGLGIQVNNNFAGPRARQFALSVRASSAGKRSGRWPSYACCIANPGRWPGLGKSPGLWPGRCGATGFASERLRATGSASETRTESATISLTWLFVTLVALTGCGRDSDKQGKSGKGLGGNWEVADDDSKSAPQDDSHPRSSVGDSPKSANDTRNSTGPSDGTSNPRNSGATVDEVPVSRRHPIDQIREGKRYREAIRALDAGDMKRAVEIRNELKGHPTYGVLAESIDAFMQVKRGEFQPALDAAGKLSAIPVLRCESDVLAGEALRGLGRWADSIQCLKNAVSVDPYHIRAHQWLGAIYHDTGAMQLSVEHLRRVSQLDAKDYRSLRLAGLIHLEYEKFEEAIEDYQAALQRPIPANMEIEVRRELADALSEVRRFAEALDVLKQCEPTVDILAAQAECYETSGQVEPALECTRKALEKDAHHYRANLVHGRILLAQREFEKALKSLEEAVRQDPADHEARFLFGRALLLSGNKEQGEAEIEASTEQKERFLKMSKLHLEAMSAPQNEGVRWELAKLAEELGRPRIAMMWYRAVLGLAPEDEGARKALERLTADKRTH